MTDVTGSDRPSPPVAAIAVLAQQYFDALYEGDADLFATLFHPAARLFCAANGDLVQMDVPQYLAVVRGRASPASRGDRRQDEIVCIDVASPTTAHLRTRELFLPKRFVDELTLVSVGGRWLIVSKVWHFEMDAGL